MTVNSDDRPGPVDPVAVARDLLTERFPQARAAFLGGSALTGQFTSTSDLDVVIVLAGPPAPYRESLRWHEWLVELFVVDEPSLNAYFNYDLARRRPSMARMVAGGAVLLADQDGTAPRVQAQARDLLAAGPPPLDPAERDRRRYALSAQLDDLAGSTDSGETAMIGWNVLVEAAELLLAAEGRWFGAGKWLLREMRSLDPVFADQLLAARDDPGRLAELAQKVLARTGGRLWEGYRESGTSPRRVQSPPS
jgi:hypothetical protein